MFFPLFIFMLSTASMMTLYFLMPQPSILTLLFILEAATLSSLITMFLFFWSSLFLNPFLMFIFITLSACAASLGLAMLVAMVRFWGSDTLKTSSISLC